MDAQPDRRDRILDVQGFPGRREILESTEDSDGAIFRTRWRSPRRGSSRRTCTRARRSATRWCRERCMCSKVTGGRSSPQASRTRSPGTTHAFQAKGRVEVINAHEPAMRYEAYFRRFHRLKVEWGVQMPPRTFRGAVLLGMLQAAYEPEFIGVRPATGSVPFLGLARRCPGIRAAGLTLGPRPSPHSTERCTEPSRRAPPHR